MANRKDSATPNSGKLSRRKLLKNTAAYAAGVAAVVSGQEHADSSRGTHKGPPGVQVVEYIVIGSGPGGGPLACNLAKAGHRVVLMEAGSAGTDPDLQPTIRLPILFGNASADPRIAWQFFVQHYANNAQQQLDSKYVPSGGGVLYPRGSTIGGSSIHNLLIMTYPSNSDWDHIASITGDNSWAPDNMRNYFQRLELCRYAAPPPPGGPDPARHGFDGWLPTETADPRIFLADSQITQMIQASIDVMGKPGDLAAYTQNTLDANDYTVTVNDIQGVYSLPMSRLNGARFSVREQVLLTAALYPNHLTVMTDCLVSRVIMDGPNAKGVEYMQGAHLYGASPLSSLSGPGPKTQTLMASREVIISGGTFNSPQILKLSGIGPTDELTKLGIRTNIDLPGVGTGMMDRYEIAVVSQLKAPYSIFNQCSFGSPNDACLFEFLQGQGIYTTNNVALAGIVKSDPSRPDRDLCLFLLPGQFHGYYPGWQNALLNPFVYTWVVLKAHNVNNAGTVTLRSADPRDPPVIDFHYFNEGNDTAGQDLAGIFNGVQLARKVNAELSSLTQGEIFPGPNFQSPSDTATWIKNEAWGHHASCSNRMGMSSDPSSVVDSNFKVHGTNNLRVVDASVFPRIPGYFPMIPIMMISEKATDVILAAAGSNPPERD